MLVNWIPRWAVPQKQKPKQVEGIKMTEQEFKERWKSVLVGQDYAVDQIAPWVMQALAGLNPPNVPAGKFFLLGPTGVGKTLTAESLAQVLHGNTTKMITVNCGEFQMDHEIAKMVGSPPGYLGHRETQPVFTSKKLTGATSDRCPFTIILFDEIEKAAPSMWRLLLGILDKATMTNGDNNIVDFEKTFIFMTSNLGVRDMLATLDGGMGFKGTPSIKVEMGELNKIGKMAIAAKFPPEFPNRIDETIVYRPLEPSSLLHIAEIEMKTFQALLETRLGSGRFSFDYTPDVLKWLVENGTSVKYGAREIKRIVRRHIYSPLVRMMLAEEIPAKSKVVVKVYKGQIKWCVTEEGVDTPKKRKGKNEEDFIT